MIGQRARLYLNTAFVIALFIILLFGRLAYYSTEAHAILLGAFIVLGSIWIWYVIKHPIGLLQSPLTLGWLSLLAAIAISSAYSLNPAQSWRVAWSWAVVIAAFYLVLFFLRLKLFTTKLILQSFALVFSTFVIASLLEVGQIFASWLSTDRLMPFQIGTVNGLTESQNLLAVFVIWFIAICYGLYRKASRFKFIFASGIIVAVPILIVLKSAGGYLAFLSMIFVFALGSQANLINQLWRKTTAKQIKISAAVLASVIALGIIVVFNWLSFDSGFLSRTKLWGIAWESFTQNWLTGLGMGTYISSFLASPSFPLKQFPLFYAHSLWFNLLADFGLVGVIAVGILVGQGVWFLFKKRSLLLTTPYILTLSACLTTFFIHSLVETPRPRMMLVAVIFLACLIYELEPEPEKSNKTVRLALLFWPGLYILLGVGLWHSFGIQQQYELGLEQAEVGAWREAADFFDQAHEKSILPDTGIMTAAAYAHARVEASPEDLKIAADYYQQLIKQEPSWPINYLHLALIQHQSGDIQAAEQSFLNTAKIASEQPYILLNLALFYEEIDQKKQAQETYQQLFLLQDTWHQAPIWEDQAKTIFESDCISTSCFYFEKADMKQAWELLANGQQEESRTILEAIQPSDIYRRHPSIYTALYLTQSEMTENLSADQMLRITTMPNSFFDRFVAELFMLDYADEELLDLTLNHALAHSAHEFGSRFNGDYIRLGFLRSAMPYDLLPGVQCFTADDHLDWQLTQLQAWYQTNELDNFAQTVNAAKLGPNGSGVQSCINLD